MRVCGGLANPGEARAGRGADATAGWAGSLRCARTYIQPRRSDGYTALQYVRLSRLRAVQFRQAVGRHSSKYDYSRHAKFGRSPLNRIFRMMYLFGDARGCKLPVQEATRWFRVLRDMPERHYWRRSRFSVSLPICAGHSLYLCIFSYLASVQILR
jgi:hypothetical protein